MQHNQRGVHTLEFGKYFLTWMNMPEEILKGAGDFGAHRVYFLSISSGGESSSVSSLTNWVLASTTGGGRGLLGSGYGM